MSSSLRPGARARGIPTAMPLGRSPRRIVSQPAGVRNALWAVALLACGGEPAPDAGIPRAEPAAPPTLEEAWGMDVASLGRAANDLGALAAEQAGRPEGVANARRAAELARVL